MELDRIPVVRVEELLQSAEGVENDAVRVHSTITAFMDGLVAQGDERCRKVELLCDVLHRELPSLLRLSVLRGGRTHLNKLDKAKIARQKRSLGFACIVRHRELLKDDLLHFQVLAMGTSVLR